jgi:hypothetical protein
MHWSLQRRALCVLASAVTILAALALAGGAAADNGNARATLSFFSGGNGAHADWLNTYDQPPGDLDHQAIRLITTNGAPTFEKGYAGILVHHVTGIPAEVFPDSAFWVKTPCPYFGYPYTLGSPRLVVEFQDALGNYVGKGELRENVRNCGDWEQVSDHEFPEFNATFGAYPNSAWDVTGGSCGFLYNVQWSNVQSCFAGDTVLEVFVVADAYGVYHLIDDISVEGKRFSSASDNSNGDNTAAGPDLTVDLSLLPAIMSFPS